MRINLEELQHQREALDNIIHNFPLLDDVNSQDKNGISATSIYANPLIQYAGQESAFLDVKMETGTGKTYVYTRMMYELNAERGLSKFVVVVPSLAIKEGAKNFLTSDYARQHFSQFFPNKNLRVYQILAGDFAKKNGRYQMSNDLEQFTSAMTNDKNTIHVLLMSDKGFLDKATSALFKDHYDVSLITSARTPAEAIMMTRPVVIIDEPHRLKRDGKSYSNILNRFKPEIIVRFGATFPEKPKSKTHEIDYYRSSGPVYDLDAVRAFNQALVKGVETIYPTLTNPDSAQYKVTKLSAKSVTFKSKNREYEVNVGDSLASVFNDNNFDGDIIYEGSKKLSNDLELHEHQTLISGTFDNSYQELMLKILIDEHFDKEQENFFREGYQIKTLSLVFIDNIPSYRDQNGWLKQAFERLLNNKLDDLIIDYQLKTDEISQSYLDFLRTTKSSLNSDTQTVHGGYFAKDWGEPDDSAVAAERDDILHKERTLPFKNEKGEWNLRRFFFSKWTLREGWDNPNVFVIAKLRSSGSDNSKIQEVGRGLRLPVDVKGNRISNKEFYLSYIVGYDESNFADKLQGEINKSIPDDMVLGEPVSDAIIQKLIDLGTYGETKRAVQNTLADDGILDDDFNVINVEGLRQLLPKVNGEKIKKRPDGAKQKNKIKLNKRNWDKIKDFWLTLSKRYMVKYEDLTTMGWLLLLSDILQNDILQVQHSEQTRQRLAKKDDLFSALTLKVTNEEYQETAIGKLTYGEFIKRIAMRTNLSIQIVHQAFSEFLPEFVQNKMENGRQLSDYFNESSVSNFVSEFKKRFDNKFSTLYRYQALAFDASTSIWDKSKQDFKDEVDANLIGQNESHEVLIDETVTLYEGTSVRFDSEVPELDLLKQKYKPQVTSFGKLPKSAIKIPKYTGGTTTPDFVYSVNGDLYLLVETKADNKRNTDDQIVDIQTRFFNQVMQDKVIYKEAHKIDDVLNVLEKLND